MNGKSLVKHHCLKKKNHSNLNMEEITDADYMHAKGVFEDFEIKNLDEYLDLYLNSNTLLLADVFQNIKKMCLKIYHLDAAKISFTSVLAWQAA